jgi:SpoVK/Ycf46/Vps4 family AAA+-type ATPase
MGGSAPDDALLASLTAAVEASPEDVPLRLHLAEMLASADQRDASIRHAAVVLQRDPTNQRALAIIGATRAGQEASAGDRARAERSADSNDEDAVLAGLERELEGVVPPMFADAQGGVADAYEVERVGLRLADVAGMSEVKERLEASVLAPMRNPELKRLYGKSLSGGLLLYGPPGCGKTFIARALAGELNAGFVSVSLADVLDIYIGQSERNIRAIFDSARRNAPCVVFLDEVDAIGLKRSQLRNSAARGTVNQLLEEMDGVSNANDGVFVLGATNHPWDVDVALRRPGRFDRMLLVLPPDEAARAAVLRYHLRDRPVANVDVVKLARRSDGFSGADLAYVCEVAAERALLDSARTGSVRMIEMRDLEHALSEVRPSIGPWLDTARNVAQFANDGGTYDELLAYLRKRRLV